MELLEKMFTADNGLLIVVFVLIGWINLQWGHIKGIEKESAALKEQLRGLPAELQTLKFENSCLKMWNKDYISQRDEAVRRSLDLLKQIENLKGLRLAFPTSPQHHAAVVFMLVAQCGGCRLGPKPDDAQFCGLTIQTHFGRLLMYYPAVWDADVQHLAPLVQWDWSSAEHAELVAAQSQVVTDTLLYAQKKQGAENANG